VMRCTLEYFKYAHVIIFVMSRVSYCDIKVAFVGISISLSLYLSLDIYRVRDMIC